MEPIKKPRIGVVGTGLIAVSHVQGIRNSGRECIITALCDNEPGKADQFAAILKIEGAKTFTDYKELVDSGLCDTVSICTSNDMHKPILEYAVGKGLAVLCEKPIGMDEAEVADMAKTAGAAGVPNLAAFTYRHIPAINAIKKLVEDGTLGEIRHFRSRMFADRMAALDHPLEWRHLAERAGSGTLGDLASHCLDMGMYILGDTCGRINRVYSEMSIVVPQRRDPKTGEMVKVTNEDVCNMMGKYDSGADIIVETSRHFPFVFEVVVSGEKGVATFSLDDYDQIILMLYDSPADYFRTRRVVPIKVPGTPLAPEPGDRMARQYRYYLGCLNAGEMPHPTIGETLEIAHLLDVIKESANKGMPLSV